MKTLHFRDLQVWQCTMQLARGIYRATESFPRREIFGLSSQLRRAAVSIPSNIAEGHGRLSDKSLAVFLAQARGSLNEVETQLELAARLGYLSNERLQQLLADCAEAGRMLNGLISKVRNSTR
jgi:four helix bundle protein